MNLISAILLFTGFMATHSSECLKVCDFFDSHKPIEQTLQNKLGHKRTNYALAIVAPEVCCYSVLSDKVETYTLKVLYAQTGEGDFSIGYFQMKPSFAEQIETIIKNNDSLKKKYSELIILEDTPHAIRAERVSRLSSLKYQTIYLAAFYEIASSRVVNWASSKESIEQRIKNIATLYNGGLNLSEDAVIDLQSKKQFPTIASEKYNYSNLVIYFYHLLYGKYN